MGESQCRAPVISGTPRGSGVSGYRHYRFDGAGRISSAEWLDAADDDAAVRQVRELNLPFRSEIWDRNRLVARIDSRTRD